MMPYLGWYAEFIDAQGLLLISEERLGGYVMHAGVRISIASERALHQAVRAEPALQWKPKEV